MAYMNQSECTAMTWIRRICKSQEILVKSSKHREHGELDVVARCVMSWVIIWVRRLLLDDLTSEIIPQTLEIMTLPNKQREANSLYIIT